MRKREFHIRFIVYWLIPVFFSFIHLPLLAQKEALPPVFRITANQKCVDYESLDALKTFDYQRHIIVQFINSAIPLDSCAKDLPTELRTLQDVPKEALLNSQSLSFDIQPVHRKDPPTFLFYLFLMVAGIVAYTRTAYNNYTKKIDESFWNVSLAKQFFKDYNHNNLLLNILLSINIVLTLSLLAYVTIKYFEKLPDVSNQLIFLITTVVTTLYILGRRVILSAMAIVLPLSSTIKFYLFNLKIVNASLILVLLPPLVVFAFATEPTQTLAWLFVVGILIMFLCYLLYRGLVIAEKIWTVYKFHFFLYLCVFELLPLIILYKLIELYIY